MEEKTHRNSSPLTIMTVLAVILLIAAVILSVICVRQRNMLRYKSIVTLSMAYAYMQEVYAGEEASIGASPGPYDPAKPGGPGG